MSDATFLSIWADYEAARSDYEAAKKLSDEAHGRWRATEAKLVDHMLATHTKKVELDSGLQPTLVNSVSISVTQANDDLIRDWLKQRVGDDKDYVRTQAYKPAVLEYVKELVKNGDPVPEFLNCDTRPTLRVTGWRWRDA